MRISLLALASLVVVTGCVGAPPVAEGPFVSERAPFVLDVPTSLRPLGGDETFEMVFQDSDGELFVGLVIEEGPRALEDLDALVERNLKKAGYDGARVIDVEKTTLGGFPAHRSIIHVLSGNTSFLMLNTHTSTENESVQLVVWGISSIGHLVRATANSLSLSRFKFRDGTRAFVNTERHTLDEAGRPFAFSAPPLGWSPSRKGALHPNATVELEHKSGGFFAFALVEPNGGRPFVDETARLTRDLAPLFEGGLVDVSPEKGTEPDVSFSVAGMLAKERVHVTYRVRLLRVGDDDVSVFCWGESAAANLATACAQVHDTLRARPKAR